MSRLILVLGCHRSGTSLVTASLPCLGVDLGDRLQAPAADNPRGFFENLDFQKVNESVLDAIGASWDTLGPLNLKDVSATDEVRSLLAENISRYPIFGLKDPRFCRLLPFWKPVFRAAGLSVSCVIVLRHPTEVILSLHTRNQFSEIKGYSIWLVNMLAAMTEKDPDWPMVVVDYDRMLANPQLQISRIGKALNLGFDPEKYLMFMNRIHDPSLRHEHVQRDIGSPNHVLVNRVYDELLKLSRDQIDPFHMGKFLACELDLKNHEALLIGLDNAEKQKIIASYKAKEEGMFKWPG